MILPGCSLSLRYLAIQTTIPDRKKSIPSTSWFGGYTEGLPGRSADFPPARLAIYKRACRWSAENPDAKARQFFSRSASGAGYGKDPSLVFLSGPIVGPPNPFASLLQWSRNCSCYWRPVLLKGETSTTPERSTPYAGHWQQGRHQSCEGVRLANREIVNSTIRTIGLNRRQPTTSGETPRTLSKKENLNAIP